MRKEVEYKGDIIKIPNNLKELDGYLYARLLDTINHDHQIGLCVKEINKIKDSIAQIQQVLKADGITIPLELDMNVEDDFTSCNLLKYYPYDKDRLLEEKK